jgi:hypothetical protein
MGYSRGVAKLTNGDVRHLIFNNTSDVIASDLFVSPDIDSSSSRTPLQIPLSSQPRLARISIEYGRGLAWKSWVSHDATQVLMNLSMEHAINFDLSFTYGQDPSGTVHVIEEFSGFGYSYSNCLCNHVGDTSIISMSEAEGRLCLSCLNNYLSRAD